MPLCYLNRFLQHWTRGKAAPPPLSNAWGSKWKLTFENTFSLNRQIQTNLQTSRAFFKSSKEMKLKIKARSSFGSLELIFPTDSGSAIFLVAGLSLWNLWGKRLPALVCEQAVKKLDMRTNFSSKYSSTIPGEAPVWALSVSVDLDCGSHNSSSSVSSPQRALKLFSCDFSQ